MAPSRGGVSSRQRRVSLPHSSEHDTPTLAPHDRVPVAGPLHNRQPLLLRAEDAAALLGVSVRAVYRIAAERKIPPACIVHLGRSVRFSRPALLRWLHADDAHAEADHAE